jgi:acetyltransferase-like isoleucine patch superfamily enzyme
MGSLGRGALAVYQSILRARNKAFSVSVGGAFAEFGRGTVLELPVRLSGSERIAIQGDVFVGADSWLRAGEEGTGIALTIGEGTSIAGACVLSAEHSITVGKRVLMARNVYIADHAHEFGDPTTAILDQGVSRIAPVVIGDGAWLGQNVFIGPGVRIGAGAVVGANSVVLSDVEDHAVAVGAPARTVRRSVTAE